jgi:hypothetical protein
MDWIHMAQGTVQILDIVNRASKVREFRVQLKA